MILELPVSHLMTKEVTFVHPSEKLLQVKHIFEKKNFHHHIPVIENGKIKGMISLQDFLVEVSGHTLSDSDAIYNVKTAGDIMRSHPVTISSDSTLRHACRVLSHGDVHALVVCENSVVKGMLSTTDIVNYVLTIDENENTDRS
jgi:CBS domain-containing protein